MRVAVAVLTLAVAALAEAAGAQTPDSTAVAPPYARALPSDSLAAPPPRPLVAPFGPAPGRALTPVPAITARLSVPALIADAPVGRAPVAFDYALGAPGRSGGVALDGHAPDAAGLSLDGRPLTDLFTDSPRLDLLPLGAIGPIRTASGTRGRATALEAEVRDFRLAVPITEIRYLGGQNGVRHVSGTHAQTRRPPRFLRGGSNDSRLTGTFHAASRAATGPLAGGRLRHTDALGRLLLTRPGLAAELGVLYADRTEGARAGVVGDSLGSAYEFETATPRGAGAQRRTLRTEVWARARVPLGAAPTEAGASYVAQRLVYTSSEQPDLRAHGSRLTGFLQQPLRAGTHRLSARLESVLDLAPDAEVGGFASAGSRLGLHATVRDSLRLGSARLAVGAGVHGVGGEVWPSASVRAEGGAWWLGARLGGRPRSRLEQVGLAPITPLPNGPTTRTAQADAGLAVSAGDWRLGLRLAVGVERDGRVLAARSDSTFAVERVPIVSRGTAGASVGWRETTTRGLYVSLGAHAQSVAVGADALRQRLDAALPRAWGQARVGVRAEGVGDGVLDLDLAAVGHGWTAFRSRLVEPVTGLLPLPLAGTPLGVELLARATLGLEATATFSAQASLFIRYDHVLGDRLYDGAIVTQGEPLVPHVVRFGVFWALLN